MIVSSTGGHDLEVGDFDSDGEVNILVTDTALSGIEGKVRQMDLYLGYDELVQLRNHLDAVLDPEREGNVKPDTYVRVQWVGEAHPLLPALQAALEDAVGRDRSGVMLDRQVMRRVLEALGA